MSVTIFLILILSTVLSADGHIDRDLHSPPVGQLITRTKSIEQYIVSPGEFEIDVFGSDFSNSELFSVENPYIGGHSHYLFLSEGSEFENSQFQLADKMADKSPMARIVKTDISYRDKTQGNLTQKYMDNTQAPFPFVDNQFDFIHLGRGLCRCSRKWAEDSPSCAGITLNSLSGENFIREIVRVLDTTRPGNYAFLQGGANLFKDDINNLIKLSKRSIGDAPIKVEMLLDEQAFNGIVFITQ